MRRTNGTSGTAGTLLVALCLGFFATFAGAQEAKSVDKETFEQWMKDLSNEGRWGADDELGTVNFITPEVRKRAAALVREGVSVSLAHDVEKEAAVDVTSPFEHTMGATGARPVLGHFASDTFSVDFHGYAHTHMDAVCHMFDEGHTYNGYSQDLITDEGCARLSIHAMKQGIFTRGILMDMAEHKGVGYLEPGTAIYAEDLEAWEKKAGVKVGEGDVVFIRTGRWKRRAELGPWDVGSLSAGLHASSVAWLKERGVAVLGSDAASDVFPSGVEGASHAVHQLVLVALGMPIFDNCDLEDISREAKARGRWDFLLTVAPLAVPNGTGSPMNPIATF